VISIFAAFSPLLVAKLCIFGFSCQELGIVVCFLCTHNTVCIQCCSPEPENYDFLSVRETSATLSLTGNCESISFRCTVPLGCFRTIAERKSNVSGYLLQNGAQLYVLLEPYLLLNSTCSITLGACMDNVACSHL
jgi:hypothetical protein